ncbi:MAG: hypothetical protein V7724_19300, partial [Sediminicola sp.]
LVSNTLSIEGGNGVDLSGYLDNTDGQDLTGASLGAGNILQIDIENGSSATVDLSSLANTGTDDQTLDLVSNTLSIEGGNGVDLSGYLDNTDDQQLNDALTTYNNGTTTLSIVLENGGTATADLSALEESAAIAAVQTDLDQAKVQANNAINANTALINGHITNDGDTDATNELQNAAEVDLDTTVDVDGDGTAETNVEQAVQDMAPIVSKSARIFYPPSIAVDASTTGTGRTINLYTQYTSQFATPAVGSAGAPASIPTYAANELYYYVTYYDNTVFSNVSISNTGVMTYNVIAAPADYNSLINVVFVVK